MSDLEHSRELQEKFELYLLALIVTILGLAVQTAKLGTNRAANHLGSPLLAVTRGLMP